MIKNSFRYYRNIYGKANNRDINFLIFIVLIILLISLCFFFFVFFRILLFWELKKLSSKNTKIAFAFTEYDFNIASQLNKLGIDFEVYVFGVNKKDTLTISNKLIFISALAFPFITLNELFKSFFDPIMYINKTRIFKLCGIKNVIKVLLKDKKVLINFNDHSIYDVYTADYAKKISIRTVYIQHAPVGYHFPELYHDLNVLFSEDSLEKYKNSQKMDAFLFFDIRFLTQFQINGSNDKRSIVIDDNKIKTILICSNEDDNIKMVYKTAKEFYDYGFKVIIRPHPREVKNFIKENYYEISQGNDIWSDLNRCHIVFTNESAVALEAIFSNKFLYKTSFFSKSRDNYSFIKKELIYTEYHDFTRLKEAVLKNELTYDICKLKYFIGDFKEVNKKALMLNEKLNLLNN